MTTLACRKLDLSDLRYWQQNARHAIRDIYDGIIELVTNSDDAYARAGTHGRIDIEIERRRRGSSSLLKVRDFAGGLTHDDMNNKLSSVGSRRHSGLADGGDVRGTNSRGAKDVAALGLVTFESITDGQYVRCQITTCGDFLGPTFHQTNAALRRQVGIAKGTGTLVSIEVDPSVSIPQHETLAKNLSLLVPLRDILAGREVVLRDLTQDRYDSIRYHIPEGTERVDETIKIPGYPGIQAKLVIKRAKKSLDSKNTKFRHGGIAIKSRRAIHEATLFAPEFEHDPHAAFFFGKLRCEYIDNLWNEYDKRMENGLPTDPTNPCPIFDPNRQAGLRRDHPFFKALQQEVLKRLRPLVDEERKREAAHAAVVENRETRRQLNELEKLATKFMEVYQEDEDARDNPTDQESGRKPLDFRFNPPFVQIVVTHRQKFWLNVNQEKYPEFAVGSTAQIEPESDAISCSRPVCPFEQHPNQEGVLRCVWEVVGERPSKATGIIVRAGSIVADAAIEVLSSERDKYADLKAFQFTYNRYSAIPGARKRLRLLAPCPDVISSPTVVQLSCDSRLAQIEGDRVAHPRDNLGIAECRFHVTLPNPDMKVRLVAEIPGHRAEAEVFSKPKGDAIKIKLDPDDKYKNQRSFWQNDGRTLVIATKHPSVQRYLGLEADHFPGQSTKHFKVLLAEIVAFAVCERILSRNVVTSPGEYPENDFDGLIAERDKLVTKFLPLAHESQVPDPR